MNIHCMHCGHGIVLDSTYDDFSGPLRCSVCKGMMMVRIHDGQLRAMEPFPPVAAATSPALAPPAFAPMVSPTPIASAAVMAAMAAPPVQPTAAPARVAGNPTGLPTERSVPDRNGSVPPGNPGVNR